VYSGARKGKEHQPAQKELSITGHRRIEKGEKRKAHRRKWTNCESGNRGRVS